MTPYLVIQRPTETHSHRGILVHRARPDGSGSMCKHVPSVGTARTRGVKLEADLAAYERARDREWSLYRQVMSEGKPMKKTCPHGRGLGSPCQDCEAQ